MPQCNIRFQPDDYNMIERHARGWGISVPEYARLQVLKGSRWTGHRFYVTDMQMRGLLAPPEEEIAPNRYCVHGDLHTPIDKLLEQHGYTRVPNGWWKVPLGLQWFYLTDHRRKVDEADGGDEGDADA